MLSRVIAISRLPEIAWYAYLLLLAMFLFGSALSILSASPTVFDGLDVPMAATALVGVFGFVSRMRILSLAFWRVFMPALLAWDIAYNLVLAGQLDLAMRSVEPMEGFPWDLVAGLTFLAPMYVALFLYGYYSKPIWSGQTEIRLPRLPGLDSKANPLDSRRHMGEYSVFCSSYSFVCAGHESHPNDDFCFRGWNGVDPVGSTAIGSDRSASAPGFHLQVSGL